MQMYVGSGKDLAVRTSKLYMSLSANQFSLGVLPLSSDGFCVC